MHFGYTLEDITNKLIDVVVVDDRANERDEIATLLEECGCRPHFFNDYKNAFDAIRELVGHRLLVNYQLCPPKNLGAFLLGKLAQAQFLIPTIVMNCSEDTTIVQFCHRFPFVKHVFPAQNIMNFVVPICQIFNPDKVGDFFPERYVMNTPKIFIIHGRNLKVKDRILKVLQNFTVEAIVLSAEPVLGHTIIDELGRYSEVDFAIALFTCDDQGRELFTEEGEIIPTAKRPKLSLRARQNVVFETGLLRSELGKDRVLIFCEDKVELPSDLGGVRYINLKENNAQLSKRLKQIFDDLGMHVPYRRT